MCIRDSNGVERRATVLDGGSAEGADGTVIDRNVIYVEGVGASRNNWLHRWEEYAQPSHQVMPMRRWWPAMTATA